MKHSGMLRMHTCKEGLRPHTKQINRQNILKKTKPNNHLNQSLQQNEYVAVSQISASVTLLDRLNSHGNAAEGSVLDCTNPLGRLGTQLGHAVSKLEHLHHCLCYLYLPGYRFVFWCTDLLPSNTVNARHWDRQIGKKTQTNRIQWYSDCMPQWNIQKGEN